jgi:hypothetical protein
MKTLREDHKERPPGDFKDGEWVGNPAEQGGPGMMGGFSGPPGGFDRQMSRR